MKARSLALFAVAGALAITGCERKAVVVEMARFTVAQVKAPSAAPASRDGRTGAEKVEDAAKRVGDSLKDAARKTGDAIKEAVR